MDGFSLLLSLAAIASPGVTYSFEKAPDNQQQYTIQIPPEFIPLIVEGQGQEIQSDVPPQAGQIQRLCIRIGTPVQRTAAAETQFRQLLVSAGRYASADRTLTAADAQPTILWPARASPELSYAVRTGWQPDASGNQFFVQVDRTVFRTLESGDEIYVPVDPAAGKPARFIVRAGTEKDNLPRISPPPQPGQSPLSQSPNAAAGRSRFGGLSDARPGSTNSEATRPPARFDSTSPVAPPANFSALEPPTSGAFQPRDDNRLLQPPQTAYGDPAASRPPAYGSWPPETRIADARGLPAASAPPAIVDQPRGTLPPPPDITPVPNYAASPPNYAASAPTYAPPTSGLAAPAPAYSPPPANYGPQTYNPPQSQQPAAHYPPPADTRLASVPAAPSAAAPSGFPPTPSTSPAAAPPPAKESWGPFVVVLFALFFSIGGNLYLAWTALEFHSRYRTAMERLRSAARGS